MLCRRTPVNQRVAQLSGPSRTGDYMSRRGILTILSLFCVATFIAGTRAQTTSPIKKKVVFLAGPKDHGAVGRHEYEKDLRELAWQLENAGNLRGMVETKVLVGKAPR